MNQLEFERHFSSEDQCRDYLRQIHWPEGPWCPKCGGVEFWSASRDRQICKKCKYEAHLLKGTIFHRTHMPLSLWFRAAWWFTNQKQGVNALGLQRALGLTRHQTARSMLKKLRFAMVSVGREPLSGEVEVDESFVGGRKSGKRGRGAEGKQLVIIAAEINGRFTGRIRMRRIPNASASTLKRFVTTNITSESTVITDGWRGYSQTNSWGYKHKTVNGAVIGDKEVLPRVHRAASLLKRWILGTYHGSVDPDHLDNYLDEFVFRFNRRTSRSRGLLFYRLLQNSIQHHNI